MATKIGLAIFFPGVGYGIDDGFGNLTENGTVEQATVYAITRNALDAIIKHRMTQGAHTPQSVAFAEVFTDRTATEI